MALRQAPGGTSSICLGGDAPAGAGGTRVSSNVFASGANQNAGNFVTDRPSTRVRCGPGGNSSICLGGDPDTSAPPPRKSAPRAAEPVSAPGGGYVVGGAQQTAGGDRAVSSNSWASGVNQNSGNFISERSSTRIHQGPGGKTSICLGHDDGPQVPDRPRTGDKPVATPQVPVYAPQAEKLDAPMGGARGVSSNLWASGANQNAGNFISERSSTRIHAAPGGNSTLTLG